MTEGELVEAQRGPGRVAYLRLNRPRKRNALNTELGGALRSAAAELALDQRVSVVVLTGNGDTFSAGADVNELRALNAGTARTFITRLHEAIAAVRAMPQVVIAAIQGHCYGGALELAAACDLRVAAAGALLGMPEIRVGMPSVIEAALLAPLMGLGSAVDLVLTGDPIPAGEALRLGLVSRVFDQQTFEADVAALAARIAGYSGPALRLQKSVLRRWTDERALQDAIDASIDLFAEAFASPNPSEAITAFLERREPHFRDG